MGNGNYINFFYFGGFFVGKVVEKNKFYNVVGMFF